MLDIDHIRSELNELPFKDGKREVFVGNISELFDEESERAIAEQLRKYEKELNRHTLFLSRPDEDKDALFVGQKLRSLSPDFSWMAEATNWVSKTLEMISAGIGGVVARSSIRYGIPRFVGTCSRSTSRYSTFDTHDQEQAGWCRVIHRGSGVTTADADADG